MQSIFDLIFSGVLILIRYLMKMWEMVLAFCYSGGFVRDYKHELDRKNKLRGQTVYLWLVRGFRNKNAASVLLLIFLSLWSIRQNINLKICLWNSGMYINKTDHSCSAQFFGLLRYLFLNKMSRKQGTRNLVSHTFPDLSLSLSLSLFNFPASLT